MEPQISLSISIAGTSLADKSGTDFASNHPQNLWGNRTALEKPLETPLEKPAERPLESLMGNLLKKLAAQPLEKAPLMPFSIRGRLLRDTA